MTNGGTSLFDFVLKAHRCISSGQLAITEWHRVCQSVFKQMLHFTHNLHAMNVCHLDISLENLLINDVLITVDSNMQNSMRFVSKPSIKFCDFGLAQIFDKRQNPHFLCNKYVGKTGYKSPEIYQRKQNFNAKAADTWSLGVSLFAMLMGSMPFNKPSSSDPTFQWIMNGHLLQLINQWKKAHYVNAQTVDLLSRIFVKEEKRINTKQLLSHSWFNSKE
eukprot:TRINITY_DN3407_c0_g1_i1.p1 TRINITY_DN3407_c0_g1~~TRINITY_DN3407_c0_g1_i1.p1  ORF type:complete len:219 (-),score=13.24 TRINITY_DN3407_c0_g1_i1:442-1098(-)